MCSGLSGGSPAREKGEEGDSGGKDEGEQVPPDEEEGEALGKAREGRQEVPLALSL